MVHDRAPYEYVVVRVVPRVERGECVNAGVILICRPRTFLGARILLDRAKVLALDPAMSEAALDAIEEQLRTMCLIAEGEPEGGPLARLTDGERWHLLSAPASTILQPSPVHTGLSADPAKELDDLFTSLVLPPVREDIDRD